MPKVVTEEQKLARKEAMKKASQARQEDRREAIGRALVFPDGKGNNFRVYRFDEHNIVVEHPKKENAYYPTTKDAVKSVFNKTVDDSASKTAHELLNAIAVAEANILSVMYND